MGNDVEKSTTVTQLRGVKNNLTSLNGKMKVPYPPPAMSIC